MKLAPQLPRLCCRDFIWIFFGPCRANNQNNCRWIRQRSTINDALLGEPHSQHQPQHRHWLQHWLQHQHKKYYLHIHHLHHVTIIHVHPSLTYIGENVVKIHYLHIFLVKIWKSYIFGENVKIRCNVEETCGLVGGKPVCNKNWSVVDIWIST